MSELLEKIRELQQEAWNEGFKHAIYNHTDHGHTLANRQQLIEHKRIKEKVMKEIEHLLSQKEGE